MAKICGYYHSEDEKFSRGIFYGGFMIFRRLRFLGFMLCLGCGLSLVSCAGNVSAGSAKSREDAVSLRVLSWNVQTFFDSVTDGGEYEEFIKSKTWGNEAYAERLSRLASSIKTLDADVVVLEELENEGVVHDISNFLAGEWSSKKVYDYACFAKSDDCAIGCGVLSRYPLENLTVHALDIRTDFEMPRMRPIMQVSVLKGEKPLVLFVNHWKSMSGGENVSEKWRRSQEAVLCRRMEKCAGLNVPALACGDFNRDISKFKKALSSDMILLRSDPGDDEGSVGTEVLSPWFDLNQELIGPGSYYYDGEWSRIDHFFACGPLEITDFEPATGGPWCDSESSIPEKYKIWDGKGYSDHLPLVCTVLF